MKYKKTVGEVVFDTFNSGLMIFLVFLCIYPFMYVIFASFSDASKLDLHSGVLWWPLEFNLRGYQLVFKNAMIFTGYANTIFYLIVGTTINIILTTFAAYALSRKKFLLKKAILLGIIFTMFFSGGMIPSYLIVKGLGLYNSRWAVILPGAMSVWNMIIMRTFFMGLPDSLEESAKLDGANDFIIFFRIILPLSKAVMAVMVLFYGVGHWNAWFNAMIYLQDHSLYPVQLVLREILIVNSTDSMVGGGDNYGTSMELVVKYASIIVTTVPILCLYPFLQKYFTKGVMIGAIKG